MDWGSFEQAIAEEARSEEERAALLTAARAIVAAHGEKPRPAQIDTFVRDRERAGAPVAELAIAQRAGAALVRFARATAAPGPSPEREREREPEPEPEPVSAAAPGSSAPAPIPPEVLAKLPASFFAGTSGGEDESPFGALLRRYAWVLDTAAIVASVLLFWALLTTYTPVTADADALARNLVRRTVGWVSGATLLSGVAGFAQRAGLLEGALTDRLGNPTLRLRFLRARGFVVLRGLLVVASAVLFVALGLPARMTPAWSTPPPQTEHAEWPAWMTDLGIFVRMPASWRWLRTTDLRAGETPIHVAWLAEGDAESPSHAIVVVARGTPDATFSHAIAQAVSHEIPRRTDGIRCRAEPPPTRTAQLCIREESPAPFVIACSHGDTFGAVRCVASWTPGVPDALTAETESVLREVGTQSARRAE